MVAKYECVYRSCVCVRERESMLSPGSGAITGDTAESEEYRESGTLAPETDAECGLMWP